MSIFKSINERLSRAEEEEAAALPLDAHLLASLMEGLTATTSPDGKTRDRSSILLVVEGGVWKAGFLCRTEGVSLWRTGETIDSALKALEAEAASESPDWRKTKPAGGSGGLTPRRKGR